MDQKYNISEKKYHSSEPKKKRMKIYPKKISDDIPSNTLKLIEEAEKNIKN